MYMQEIQDIISRVEQMEAYYDQLCETLGEEMDFSQLEQEYQEKLSFLTEYYEGGQWLKDYEADEQGLIPTDIKRGILAQDTLYDFLYTFND